MLGGKIHNKLHLLFLVPPIMWFTDQKEQNMDKTKNTKENEQSNNRVVIILPGGIQPIKRITLFLLGVSSAFIIACNITLNESLGFIALGIALFLIIFDEGLRGRIWGLFE